MSETAHTTDDEPTNDWHALPGMLADVITADGEANVACGGYHVVRDENGVIGIYREVAVASTPEELETEGDMMWDFGDHVTGNELLCKLPAPEGGWESELEAVPESIFPGYE